MESLSEENNSRFDTLLLIVALLLLVGGMGVYYGLDPQLSKLPRLGLLVAGFGGAIAAVYATNLGKQTLAYLVGARSELRKVVWPTRQESIQTTLIIAVFVVIVAMIMWGLDSALLYGVQKLTGRA
jgi:preprotein translocase subunit SecE